MNEFVINALHAIPSVAGSPFALVAYVVVVVCWAVIAWKVRRNKNLLAALDSLPEKDRLKAIELEMGAVRLKSGLTAEQWLRSQIHRYLLVGFVVACLTVVLIVALSLRLAFSQWEPEISLTVADAFSVKGVDEEAKARYEALSDRTRYSYEQQDGIMHVKPAGYLNHLRAGAIVPEISPGQLGKEYPALSYKIANNTDKTLLLSEVVFDVHASTLDKEPVLVVRGTRYGELVFSNRGWGSALNPILDIGIVPGYVCSGDSYRMDNIESRPLRRDLRLQELPTYVDISEFVGEVENIEPNCDKYVNRACHRGDCEYIEYKKIRCLDQESYRHCNKVDSRLSAQELERMFPGLSSERQIEWISYERSCHYSSVCVFGILSYTTGDSDLGLFKFHADVQFEPRPKPVDRGPSAPTEPTRVYDAFLEAGESGYEARQSIAHTVLPGETDHFVVKLRSNHSAQFDLTMSVISAGGEKVHQQRVNLLMYVPPVAYPRGALFPIKRKDRGSERIFAEDALKHLKGVQLGDVMKGSRKNE